MTSNKTISAVKELLDEQSRTFMEELKSLRDEVAALKSELAAARECHVCRNTTSIDSRGPAKADDNKATFADVVRQSVQSALQDERGKNDLVISRMDEQGDDEKRLADVCKTLECESKPAELHRLGSKKEGRTRLLKVSFPTNFDARAFRASFNNRRKTHNDLPNWRLRGHRTRSEQALFEKNSRTTFQLNSAAKEAKLNESYSLRDDGSVWKFVKQENGKWKREKDWELPACDESPSTNDPMTGNDPRSPKHHPEDAQSRS